MDASAQLALMTKAKIVFEKPETFLSFPALVPIAFPPAVLDFGKALVDPKISAALLEFSRVVNQCPTGAVFPGDSDQYLWEHYDQWLNAMVLAQDQLSAGQDAAYAQATALLTAKDANGLRTDSVTLTTYKQYRDKYLAAEQAYKNAEITASMAQDPAAKSEWQNTNEPRLRQVVAEAMSEWEAKGNKSAIEAAQAKVSACEAQMPQKVWREWRAAYNPDLDLFTDAGSNASCGPSGFAPSNVCSQPWTTFTLTHDEIHALTAQAPAELRAIFGETGASAIASVSFEFCSAAVVRAWFDSAMFDTRFWKFDSGAPDISDGGKPSKGAWPAYITAVVFARNIRVTTASAPTAPPQPIRTLPVFSFRPEVLQTLQTQRPTPVAHPQVMMMARPMMAASAAKPVIASHPSVVATTGLSNRALSPTARPVAVNPALRLNAVLYRAPPISHGPVIIHPAPTPTMPAQQPDNQVSVLAFICRALPKVPNPDPALHW